ncbi:MAG: recombinase family protein [Roseburia sp.]|nr:recombinase family protein [Roseburia sp.]
MEQLALYLRLSAEDEDGKDESNSIGNQRKQIYEYIHHDSELHRYEAEEFCDDGYSGTSMERPGMQKLLKKVKAGRIKCIIVKDMSRFSRDYIEMGTYLNQIFPFMGVRFIAINDQYDSQEHPGSTIEIDTAFQTLLYDLYSKDLSVKVKTSFANKCANGEYVFGQVPFGYKKSVEMKNTVVVNEEEACVVRHIFSLAMQGKNSTQIARQLYKEEVPTILQMRRPQKQPEDGRIHTWSNQAVRNILNNRFYLGEMVYGKSLREFVGSKGSIAVPRDEWKVIPNHHEALVTQEVFEQVASFKGKRPMATRKKHPLIGKLVCGGCRYSMHYKPLTEKNRCRRFECRKYSLLEIPECCTSIRAVFLEETVLMMLNKELMQRGNTIKQSKSLSSFQKEGIQTLKKKLELYKQESKKIQEQKDILYEKYALGEIEEAIYRRSAVELTEQYTSLSVKSDKASAKLAELESEYQKAEKDMKQIIQYSHIEVLTQEVVDTFIKKIYVYKGKRAEIEWNFR